eukprot:657099-Prymnesium_polylepis.2
MVESISSYGTVDSAVRSVSKRPPPDQSNRTWIRSWDPIHPPEIDPPRSWIDPPGGSIQSRPHRSRTHRIGQPLTGAIQAVGSSRGLWIDPPRDWIDPPAVDNPPIVQSRPGTGSISAGSIHPPTRVDQSRDADLK